MILRLSWRAMHDFHLWLITLRASTSIIVTPFLRLFGPDGWVPFQLTLWLGDMIWVQRCVLSAFYCCSLIIYDSARCALWYCALLISWCVPIEITNPRHSYPVFWQVLSLGNGFPRGRKCSKRLPASPSIMILHAALWYCAFLGEQCTISTCGWLHSVPAPVSL